MNHYLLVGLALFIYMNILFLFSLFTKKNSEVDVGYGLGFCLLALISLYIGHGDKTKDLITLLVLLWGFRLFTRIFTRNQNKPEDFRYQTWRNSWKRFYIRSYLQVFILQGVIIFLISLPILLINFGSLRPNKYLLVIGLLVWIIGYFFEVGGDYQLDEFLKLKKKPTKYLESGLWKYTRHPNYFGESTMWWGIFISTLAINKIVLIALISPVLITFLLTRVSGIPLLEKRWSGDPEWEQYKKQTSAFIPWFKH